MPLLGSQFGRDLIRLNRSGSHARSNSETKPFTETSASSISSGELNRTQNDWEMLQGSEIPRQRRVTVVVDKSKESRHAMFWALSHVVHTSDMVTLLHVHPEQKPSTGQFQGNLSKGSLKSKSSELANSLKMICSACRPEVEINVIVVEGDNGPAIVGEVKKIQTSILVLGQQKPSLLQRSVMRNHGD
eukprot:c25917_g1_i1 orf=733-1296(+)